MFESGYACMPISFRQTIAFVGLFCYRAMLVTDRRSISKLTSNQWHHRTRRNSRHRYRPVLLHN